MSQGGSKVFGGILWRLKGSQFQGCFNVFQSISEVSTFFCALYGALWGVRKCQKRSRGNPGGLMWALLVFQGRFLTKKILEDFLKVISDGYSGL